MASYATLTINAADIVGADFDRSRCSAYIETNTPHGLVVVDGTSIRLGGRRENPDATGTITFPNLVTTNSADNPTSFAYKVTIVYVPKGSRKQGHDSITTSEFQFTASADLASISAAWDDIAIPPSWKSDFMDQAQALLDQQEAIAGADTADDLITVLDANPASTFRVQQDARQAAATDARIAAQTVLKWKPSTTYPAGTVVESPTGTTVTSLVTHASGVSYNAARWLPAGWQVTADATAMQGRGFYDNGDSFGQTVGGFTSFVPQIATARGMTLLNASVGGSFWRDTTMRSIDSITPGTSAADSFLMFHCGINPAYFQGDNALGRAAERDALEVLIWLAAAASKVEETSFTRTGTWTNYANTLLSGGNAQNCNAATGYSEYTPAAGDWIAVGYTLRAGLGSTFETGTWTKDGATVYATNTAQPPRTNLEAASSTGNAQNLVPRPIRLLGLTGSNVIRQTRAASGNMLSDAMWKLSNDPPWIVIVKPTYVAPGSQYESAGTNADYGATAGASVANVDKYRRDIDAVVASVTAAYAPLRGKIIVVDPVTSGWVAATMTHTDGLHPNDTGHAFLRDLVQREVADAVRYRRRALSSGALTIA